MESNSSYYKILRDMINDEFMDTNFNSKNNLFQKYCLNKSTVSYFSNYNHLFIIEREDQNGKIQFYLREFSLEPQEKFMNKSSYSKSHLIVLENENSENFEIPKDFCLEILNNSQYNESIFVLYSQTNVFGNFFLFSIFSIFFLKKVAKISNFEEILHNNKLTFQIVGSSFDNNKILRVKWVPSSMNHIAILRENNMFMIFDCLNNIDDPEIFINLNDLEAKNKILSDQKINFIDFAFSNSLDDYDCALFSVFFMNTMGEIYYKCPFFINGMIVPKETIDFLKKRIEHEKKNSGVDKELVKRIENFLNSLQDLLCQSEDDPKNYLLNAASIDFKNDVLEGFHFLF